MLPLYVVPAGVGTLGLSGLASDASQSWQAVLSEHVDLIEFGLLSTPPARIER